MSAFGRHSTCFQRAPSRAGYNSLMQPVGDAFSQGIWWLGELSLKWIPGTVINIAEGGPWPYISASQNGSTAGTITRSYGPITHAVTPQEAVVFLQNVSGPDVYSNLFHNWSIFVALSLFATLLFSALVIYCSIRIFQVRQMERRHFAAMQRTVAAKDTPRTHLRWQRIQEEVQSENQQSWRLAILEADIMLNELLDMKGYRGETMADKMKQVERGDFQTIDLAWEAHKVRNAIAHQGSSLSLTDREARRVIALYERVFKEFNLVE